MTLVPAQRNERGELVSPEIRQLSVGLRHDEEFTAPTSFVERFLKPRYDCKDLGPVAPQAAGSALPPSEAPGHGARAAADAPGADERDATIEAMHRLIERQNQVIERIMPRLQLLDRAAPSLEWLIANPPPGVERA